MDFLEIAKFAFSVLQFLLTGGIGIYVYISNKQRVTNANMAAMETDIDDRLDDHSGRIARVEEAIKHLPSATDITNLRDLISRVGGDVRGLEGKFNGVVDRLASVQHSLQIVNDYLLNKKP